MQKFKFFLETKLSILDSAAKTIEYVKLSPLVDFFFDLADIRAFLLEAEEKKKRGLLGARNKGYRREFDDDETSLFGDKTRDLYQQNRVDPKFLKKVNKKEKATDDPDKSIKDAWEKVIQDYTRTNPGTTELDALNGLDSQSVLYLLNAPKDASKFEKDQLIRRIEGIRDNLKLGFDPANPEAKMWAKGGQAAMPHTIRAVLNSQKPVVDAFYNIGDFDVPGDQVLAYLKNNKTEVLPDKRYIDYSSIKKLEAIKTKVLQGVALDLKERKLYATWSEISQEKQVVGKTPTWSLLSAPEIYRELKARGVEVATPEEVELEFIEKIRKDLKSGKEYREDPQSTDEKHLRKTRQTGENFLGDKARLASKYVNLDVKGVKQSLLNYDKKGGMEEKDDFNPMFFATNFHKEATPDPEINKRLNAEYDRDNSKLMSDIYEPTCKAVSGLIKSIMGEKGISVGGTIDGLDQSGLCGLGKTSSGQAALDQIDKFLSGARLTFSDIINDTAEFIRYKKAGIPNWEKFGVRYSFALAHAREIVFSALKIGNKEKAGLGGGGSGEWDSKDLISGAADGQRFGGERATDADAQKSKERLDPVLAAIDSIVTDKNDNELFKSYLDDLKVAKEEGDTEEMQAIARDMMAFAALKNADGTIKYPKLHNKLIDVLNGTPEDAENEI